MHPIGQILPRLFPTILVLTAAVLIMQLLTDEPEVAEAGGDADGGGESGNGTTG
jgi:hypothetical protein